MPSPFLSREEQAMKLHWLLAAVCGPPGAAVCCSGLLLSAALKQSVLVTYSPQFAFPPQREVRSWHSPLHYVDLCQGQELWGEGAMNFHTGFIMASFVLTWDTRVSKLVSGFSWKELLQILLDWGFYERQEDWGFLLHHLTASPQSHFSI